MNQDTRTRTSGILLHPTSLPSPYGIGDLGRAAYDYVNFLHKSGQHLWQTLPLTPTGFGDSPYQSFSAFAGQPLLISLEQLQELGFLSSTELEDCPVEDESYVDYGTIIPWKTSKLRLAFSHFTKMARKSFITEFEQWRRQNAFWLDDYALFMACKDMHGGQDWLSWDKKYRQPKASTKKNLRNALRNNYDYYCFVQFIFFQQWNQLKAYANEHEVELIGDIPIFVSMDSADVWANQGLFQLDSKGYPKVVAGVPPDYFSETGQLWGNPLYNWKAHKKTRYKWWISRIRHQLKMTDYLRIDHFRGFEAYWEVPYGDETALNGKWAPGPRESLFEAIEKKLGKGLPIIAEDLGLITPEVHALRNKFGFPGMKILQFAFDSEDESIYLPHQLTTTNCVCYTGTHDNNTTKGWYASASEFSRDKVRCYMNTDGFNIHWDFIRTCLGSVASKAIFPMQDLLGVNEKGRMNTPGVGIGNWAWRYKKEDLTDELANSLAKVTRIYGR